MLYTADLHTHIDYDEIRDRRHGMNPEKAAQAMHASRLDVCAALEHNHISERYFDVLDELEKLSEKDRQRLLCLLGTELTVNYEGFMYHVGLIFEEKFHRGNLPVIPPPRLDLKLLEEYMIDYPSVSILYHPTWQYWKTNGEGLEATQRLMNSGLVDGVEILNGSILYNGQGSKHQAMKKASTKKGLELFMQAKKNDRQLASIGCSDAHSPELIGAVRTKFESTKPEGIFEAIKRGRTRAEAHEQKIITPKVRSLQRSIPCASQYIGYRMSAST